MRKLLVGCVVSYPARSGRQRPGNACSCSRGTTVVRRVAAIVAPGLLLLGCWGRRERLSRRALPLVASSAPARGPPAAEDGAGTRTEFALLGGVRLNLNLSSPYVEPVVWLVWASRLPRCRCGGRSLCALRRGPRSASSRSSSARQAGAGGTGTRAEAQRATRLWKAALRGARGEVPVGTRVREACRARRPDCLSSRRKSPTSMDAPGFACHPTLRATVARPRPWRKQMLRSYQSKGISANALIEPFEIGRL